MYNGVIIKESISDELILDLVEVEKTELWKTNNNPKYWTVLFFHSNVPDFPIKLSNVLIGNWYVDMKVQNQKIIVFKDKVLEYTIGNGNEKQEVINYCKMMGIPDDQMNWAE